MQDAGPGQKPPRQWDVFSYHTADVASAHWVRAELGQHGYWETWTMWQYSGGNAEHPDLDYVNGTASELRAFVGKQ